MKTHLLSISSIPARYSCHTLSVGEDRRLNTVDSVGYSGIKKGNVYGSVTLKKITFAPIVPVSP